MLGDNIKALRKQKGFTQEELATRLNVVRQTVSKWEKGISVPDAETIQNMANEFDVSIQEILGAEIKEEPNRNEVAEQLARINEHLAVRNHKTQLAWKITSAALGIVVVVLLAFIFGNGNFSSNNPAGNMSNKNSDTTKEKTVEKLPEKLSVNSLSMNLFENKITFSPSIGNKKLVYQVIYSTNGQSKTIKENATYEGGICTANIPKEIKVSGEQYEVTLVVSNGIEERTTPLYSQLEIDDNVATYLEMDKQ